MSLKIGLLHNCRLALQLSLAVLLLAGSINSVHAQLSLTNGAPNAVIDFSTTIAGVTNGAFNGSGFQNPASAGRLDTRAWASTGWSDGALAFNGNAITLNTDYTRGSTAVSVTTGGFYAYTGTPQSAANPALMFQPGGSDFTPGTLTLRIKNDGSTIINQLAIAYNIYVRNDQPRSNNLGFSYSSDDVTYTNAGLTGTDYTSIATADGLGWVKVAGAPASRIDTIKGISIPPTSYFYIRWTSDDVSGSGARDELGIDDISIRANYPGACTPPSTNATLNAFSSVFSTQVQVNFTRGNGTGGLLVVASPAALSQNPISGITYPANSNYGSGTALGNGFVVYNSGAVPVLTAGNFTLTGLTPGTTYTLTLFEYDITVPCYTTTGVAGTQTTAGSSSTLATDYFRTRANGNWSNANTWESSPTGGAPWNNADLVPTAASSGITIQAAHTVDIVSSVTMDQTTVSGILNLANNGVINIANGAGNDIDIQNGGVLKVSATLGNYSTTFVFTAGAQINVATGGKITIGNGGSTSGYSPLASTTSIVIWNHASIFEWNTTDPFLTNSTTYFPDAVPAVIPIFRVSKSPSLLPGAASATVWKGLFEVNANVTLRLGGVKYFRNGIIGTANLTQDELCGQFVIGVEPPVATGTDTIVTAQLGGTGSIILATANASVAYGCTVTMISGKVINLTTAGNTFRVKGKLYCDSYILSGTAQFALSDGATLRLGSPGGIASAMAATGNIQLMGGRIFGVGNFIYNGTNSQVTGTGLPLTVNSLTIINTGVTGDSTVTLTNTNTTSPILNLTSGLFAIGTGQQFNISSTGSVAVGTGDFAAGSTGGILNFTTGGSFTGNDCNPYDVYVGNGGLNFGSPQKVRIQGGGSFRINAGGYANINGPYYASGSSLVYNTGSAYEVYKEWNTGTTFSTARAIPYHVTLLAGGTSLKLENLSTPSHGTRSAFGNLLINTNTSLTLSTTNLDDLWIGGNWTRAASGTSFTNNGRLVNFNGTGSNQTITVTGGGTEKFGYIQISKFTDTLILAKAPNGTNIEINGNDTSSIASNTLYFKSGHIELNQQTISFKISNNNLSNQNNIWIDGAAVAAGGKVRNIVSNGGQGIFAFVNSVGGDHFTLINRNGSVDVTKKLAFGSTVKVTVGATAGSGGIDFGVNGAQSFANNITTINGIFEIENGGYVINNSPIYGTNAFLVYNPGGSYDRSVEWATGIIQPGYPYHVTVQNNTNFFLNTTSKGNAPRYLAGNLTVAQGSSLSLSQASPVFNDPLTVGMNLVLNGTLNLAPAYGADLYLAGNWTRSSTGVFNPNERAVFFNGTTKSLITANNGEMFPYLYLQKTGTATNDSLTLADDISISREFKISTGIFNLKDKNTTLKSALDSTAYMGKFGTGTVYYGGTGRFIVERYIATGTGALPVHGKTWQFLAVPVNNAGAAGGQSVNAAWQEGKILPTVGTAGLGTIITSNIGTPITDSFDIIAGVGPSMKTWDTTGAGYWKGIPNTKIPHYNSKGYMILVRGDRNVTTSGGTATPTTLRTRGKIFEPNNPPPVITVGANEFESVGNPYASAFDFSNDGGVVKGPGIQKVFYVWDPKLAGNYGLGGFQTFTKGAGADYTVTPGTGSYGPSGSVYNRIESGQAFFVRNGSGSSTTLSFNETAKQGYSRMVNRSILNNNTGKQLRTNLYVVSGTQRILIDGVLNEFDRDYSNNVDMLDAIKMENAGENLGIAIGRQVLAVERRGNIEGKDTIQYNLAQLRIQQYELELVAQNISRQGLKAYIQDNFLGTLREVNLSDTMRISFTVQNIPASAASNRFMLVFIQKNRPAIYSLLDGVRMGGAIAINWKTAEENKDGEYTVERSADGIMFQGVHKITSNATGSYSWDDADPLPGDNFYRVHYTAPGNRGSYSNKLKVPGEGITPAPEAITISPNPVTNGTLGIMVNNRDKGIWVLKLYNNLGQLVFSQRVDHDGSNGYKTVTLPRGLAGGQYRLEVVYPTGTPFSTQVVLGE